MLCGLDGGCNTISMFFIASRSSLVGPIYHLFNSSTRHDLHTFTYSFSSPLPRMLLANSVINRSQVDGFGTCPYMIYHSASQSFIFQTGSIFSIWQLLVIFTSYKSSQPDGAFGSFQRCIHSSPQSPFGDRTWFVSCAGSSQHIRRGRKEALEWCKPPTFPHIHLAPLPWLLQESCLLSTHSDHALTHALYCYLLCEARRQTLLLFVLTLFICYPWALNIASVNSWLFMLRDVKRINTLTVYFVDFLSLTCVHMDMYAKVGDGRYLRYILLSCITGEIVGHLLVSSCWILMFQHRFNGKFTVI